jgi:hypothetical protein
MKIEINQDKYNFPKSSFIQSIKIDQNELEIKIKNNPNRYIYRIKNRSEIPQIKFIWMNQDSLSIGKFYNYLRYSNQIELIEKR